MVLGYVEDLLHFLGLCRWFTLGRCCQLFGDFNFFFDFALSTIDQFGFPLGLLLLLEFVDVQFDTPKSESDSVVKGLLVEGRLELPLHVLGDHVVQYITKSVITQ